MRTLLDTFRRLIHRAARDCAMPVVAVGIRPARPGGDPTGVYALEGVCADEVEMAVGGLLGWLQARATEGAETCPGCADRLARVQAAIAALDADAGEPAATANPTHLH